MKIAVFCMLIYLMFGMGCGTEKKEPEWVFQYQYDYWTIYDLTGSYLSNQESLETLIATYLQEIEVLLGCSDWWKDINPNAEKIIANIRITGENGMTSHASYGKKALENEVELGVTLSGMALTQYQSDGFLAHELTHIVAGPSFSISLEDGLCQYVQGTIGKSSHIPAVTEGEISFEAYFKTCHEYYKQEGVIPVDEILSAIGNEGRRYPDQKRMTWLVYSEAFCRYLITEYGMDRVMELITSGEDESAYETILGSNLAELKSEWLYSVDTMEQKYTFEEIAEMEQKYVDEIKQ